MKVALRGAHRPYDMSAKNATFFITKSPQKPYFLGSFLLFLNSICYFFYQVFKKYLLLFYNFCRKEEHIMKKVLKFAGIISAALALVGFILLMATPVATFTVQIGGSKSVTAWDGMNAIFGVGSVRNGDNASDFSGSLAWSGLLAWIFALVALLILIAGIVLPLAKVTVLEKFAGILNLVAVGLLVVAGIFAFISKATFAAANDADAGDLAIGAGWVIGGILFILGGAMAIAPAAVDFIGKKK